MTWSVLEGDVREVLRSLEAESVACCVTSPPYWQLRDYGVEGQIGLEATPEEYVAVMVDVFREVRRVLRADGTLWLNLGDTYLGGRCGGRGEIGVTSGRNHDAARAVREAMGGSAHKTAPGLKPKQLVGIPWRVALALQADGWWLRSECIWHKPSPQPESVNDRPTRDHEHVFMLSKSAHYYYDADAVKEPTTGGAKPRGRGVNPKARAAGPRCRANASFSAAVSGLVEERHKRTVWRVPQEPISDAHFATFPRGLVRTPILAGAPRGAAVLDPFAGRCTTGDVALDLGRHFIGIELNPEYAAMGREVLWRAQERAGQISPTDEPESRTDREWQLGLFAGGAA